MYIKNSMIKDYSFFVCLFLLEALLGVFVVVFFREKNSFFIALGIILLSIIILSKFRIGLYLLLIFVPLDQYQKYFIVADWSDYFIDSIAFYIPIFFVTFLSLVLFKCSHIEPESHARHPEPALNYILCLLVAWSAITLLWVSNFYSGIFQEMIFVINIALFYLLLSNIKDVVTFKKSVKTLIFMGVAISMAALSSLFLDFSPVTKVFSITDRLFFEANYLIHKPHALGLIGHNALGNVMNIIMALTLGMLLSSSKKSSKLFYFVIILLLLTAIITSRSRGALVGLFAMCTFFLFAMPSFKDKIFKYAAIFLLVFSVLFFFTLPDNFSHGMKRYASAESGKSMSKRFEWWGNASEYTFKQTLGVGMGIGGFKQRFGGPDVPHAHSIYFSHFFDFGIIGFFLFISMLFFIIKAIFSAMSGFTESFQHLMLLSCIGGLVASSLHGLIDGDYNVSIFWLLLGLTMASVNLVNEMKEDQGIMRRKDREENEIVEMGI